MQRVLLAGAIVTAYASAQFGIDEMDEGDDPLTIIEPIAVEPIVEPEISVEVTEIDTEPETTPIVVATPPPGVSETTMQIDRLDKTCTDDFTAELEQKSYQEKMSLARKTMRMMQDVVIVAQESSYTQPELDYRLEKCAELFEGEQKIASCKESLTKMFIAGEINYMTFKGKRAFDEICSIQDHIPSCKASCDLKHEFFGDPTAADCAKVREEWQFECQSRASGELVYAPSTATTMVQLKKYSIARQKCDRKHYQASSACGNTLQQHLDQIIELKGEVLDTDNQSVAKCYYKSLRNYAKCIKKAPKKPAGFSLHDLRRDNNKKKSQGMQAFVDALKKAMERSGQNRARSNNRRRPAPQNQPAPRNDMQDFLNQDDLN